MKQHPNIYAIQPNEYKTLKEEGRVAIEKRNDALVAIVTDKDTGEKQEFAIDPVHQRALTPLVRKMADDAEDVAKRTRETLAAQEELLEDVDVVDKAKDKGK